MSTPLKMFESRGFDALVLCALIEHFVNASAERGFHVTGSLADSIGGLLGERATEHRDFVVFGRTLNAYGYFLASKALLYSQDPRYTTPSRDAFGDFRNDVVQDRVCAFQVLVLFGNGQLVSITEGVRR